MNDEIENYPNTKIKNITIESFNNLDFLGMYVFLRMMIDHETTTVTLIVDRIIEKFNVSHEFVMKAFKMYEDKGLLMIIKKKD